MPDVKGQSLGLLLVTPAYSYLSYGNIILFTPTLLGKQLGRKTRQRGNGKKQGSKTNSSTDYLILVEFL